MSAQARWDQIPVIVMSPAASADRAAATRAGQSADVAPPRAIPVSILSCTRAGRPALVAAATISCSSGTASTVRSTSSRMADSLRRAGGAEQTQHPGREAGPAQRQRLVLMHHAQPLRAAGHRSVAPWGSCHARNHPP